MSTPTQKQLEAYGIAYPYRDLARVERQEQAVARWALLRAVDRFLAAERWRLESDVVADDTSDKVARLDTRRAPRPVGPPVDWYLDADGTTSAQ